MLETSGGAAASGLSTPSPQDAKGTMGTVRDRRQGHRRVRDEFRPTVGTSRLPDALFRTYRYVQLEIETGDEDFGSDLHASSSDIHQARGWVRQRLPGLRNVEITGAARDSAPGRLFRPPYYDTPYLGDTGSRTDHAVLSDDDRLVRQAIEHFDLSRFPGITASRYPSDLGITFRPFSPIWVRCCTTTGCSGRPEYVRSFLPSPSHPRMFERRSTRPHVGPISCGRSWIGPRSGQRVPPRRGGALHVSHCSSFSARSGCGVGAGARLSGAADHIGASPGRCATRCAAVPGTQPEVVPDIPGKHVQQQANVMASHRPVAPADQAALMERVHWTDAHAIDLLFILPARALRKAGLGDATSAARAVAWDARPRPDDRLRTSGTDALRLACVERAPQLRLLSTVLAYGLRSRVSRRCASHPILVRCAAPRVACRIRWDRLRCA